MIVPITFYGNPNSTDSEAMASDLEKRAREFLNRLTGGPTAAVPLEDYLHDGQVLCQLLNKIVPGSPIRRINASSTTFKQIENISTYLATCTKYGVPEAAQFDTTDLFENKGMLKVIQHLDYIARHEKELSSVKADEGSPTAKSAAPAPKFGLKSSKSFRPIDITTAPSTGVVMASLQSDVETKEEMKYNPELERMARNWISAVVKEDIDDSKALTQSLRSGVLLCKLVNAVKPGSVAKIHTSSIAYQQMENIRSYLKAATDLGLNSLSAFDVPDLYEEKNINLMYSEKQVIANIHALSNVVSKINGFNGPFMEEEDISKTKSLFSSSLVEKELEFLVEGNEGEDPANEKEKKLVNWTNSHLVKSKESKPVKNIGSNLRSGLKLIILLKVLTQTEHMGAYVEEPVTLWDCMSNARAALKFLSYQTLETFSGCSARDIVSGNVKSITLLLEYIRDKFDHEFLFNQLVSGEEEPIVEDQKAIEEERKKAEEEKRKQEAAVEEQKKKIRAEEERLAKMREERRRIELEEKKKKEEDERKKKQIEADRAELEKQRIMLEKQRKEQEIKRAEEQRQLRERQRLEEEKKTEEKKKEEMAKLEERQRLEAQRIEEEEQKLRKQMEERRQREAAAQKEEEDRLEKEKKLAEEMRLEEARVEENKKKLEAESLDMQRRQNEMSKPALIKENYSPRPTERKATIVPDQAKIQNAQYVVKKRICTELLTTEQNYVKNLVAMKELVNTLRTQEVANAETVNQIFSNIDQLPTPHSSFLKDIEKLMNNWVDSSAEVGSIVHKHGKEFMPFYAQFIPDFNNSFAALHYLRKKSAQFCKVIGTFESSRGQLDSFLILPVQRIPRYILLMRDMLKYTPESHPDHQSLKEATKYLDETLKKINSTIDNSILDNSAKILEVENQIDGDFDTLLTPKRKFIREGRLLPKSVERKSKTDKHHLTLFPSAKKGDPCPYFALFNDIIVYCDAKKEHSGTIKGSRGSTRFTEDDKLFDYKGRFPVELISKVEPNKKKDNTILVHLNPECGFDNFELTAATPQEANVWLNDLIIALMKAAKEQLLSQKSPKL